VKLALCLGLFVGRDEPDHFDGDVHGKAAVPHVDVDNKEIAANVAKGATKTFSSTDPRVYGEDYFAA
jgi:hypothetical protein